MTWRLVCVISASILFTCLLMSCCFGGMRASVKAYRGDGSIVYKKGPFLGVSGCVIRFPDIDLSQPTNVEYNLDGIPAGGRNVGETYVVYLVQPYPSHPQVPQGMFSFELRKNGVTGTNVSSRISDMVNSQGGGGNRFYVFKKDWFFGALHIDDSTSHWALVVSCSNDVLRTSVKAHIELCRGGFI